MARFSLSPLFVCREKPKQVPPHFSGGGYLPAAGWGGGKWTNCELEGAGKLLRGGAVFLVHSSVQV